jgi:hypothetical protein
VSIEATLFTRDRLQRIVFVANIFGQVIGKFHNVLKVRVVRVLGNGNTKFFNEPRPFFYVSVRFVSRHGGVNNQHVCKSTDIRWEAAHAALAIAFGFGTLPTVANASIWFRTAAEKESN